MFLLSSDVFLLPNLKDLEEDEGWTHNQFFASGIQRAVVLLVNSAALGGQYGFKKIINGSRLPPASITSCVPTLQEVQ